MIALAPHMNKSLFRFKKLLPPGVSHRDSYYKLVWMRVTNSQYKAAFRSIFYIQYLCKTDNTGLFSYHTDTCQTVHNLKHYTVCLDFSQTSCQRSKIILFAKWRRRYCKLQLALDWSKTYLDTILIVTSLYYGKNQKLNKQKSEKICLCGCFLALYSPYLHTE